MLAVLTLASMSLLMGVSGTCPPTCQCLDHLNTVECQNKDLQQIPALPRGALKLYVSYNQIQEVPERGLEELQVWPQPGYYLFETDAVKHLMHICV